MPHDPTEAMRRLAIESGLSDASAEASKTEENWTTEELRAEFKVHSFLAPLVEVTRLSTGERGTLLFGSDADGVRRYHSWET